MRPKSIILLTLALGCGLVASIGINRVMANRREAPTSDGTETTPIFVAVTDIGVGDPLTPQLIKLEPWPKEKLPAGSIGKLEDVEGRRSRAKFYPGEPILEPKLLPKGENGASAIDLIPKGMRVVPIRVDAVSGASGMILPGDRVDMLVHIPENPSRGVPRPITRTFLHNIKVFAIDDLYDRQGNQNNTMAAKTISVLVTPEQAELVALATQVGTVQLIMRNAGDDVAEDTRGADLQKLLLGHSDSDDNLPDDPRELITSLKNKPAKQPAAQPVVAPPPVDDVFVMTIISGSAPREVEFRRGKIVNPASAGPPPSAVQPVSAPATQPNPPDANEEPATENNQQARRTGRRIR